MSSVEKFAAISEHDKHIAVVSSEGVLVFEVPWAVVLLLCCVEYVRVLEQLCLG